MEKKSISNFMKQLLPKLKKINCWRLISKKKSQIDHAKYGHWFEMPAHAIGFEVKQAVPTA